MTALIEVILTWLARVLRLPSGGRIMIYLRTLAARVLAWMRAESSRSNVKDLIFRILNLGAIGIIIRDVQEAIIEWLFVSTGLEIEELNPEGMLQATGKLLAKKVNERYGTTFTSFYPIETIIEQVKQQLMAEIINAANDAAVEGSEKLLTKVQANDLMMQVVNAYRQAHNIPSLGALVQLPTSLARQKNRERQAAWRARRTAQRTIAKNDHNELIYIDFTAKYNNLLEKRKVYMAALGQLHKHQRQRDYWYNKPLSSSYSAEQQTAKLATYDNKIQVDQVSVDAALVVFNQAKIP